MGLPVVKFLKYSAAGSAEYTEIDAGGVCTTGIITANAFRNAIAMRVKVVSDAGFHLDNLKIWANDALATINGSSQDLGEGFTASAPPTPTWWSMVYVYTATGALAVDNAAIQTSAVVCPTAVAANGTATLSALPSVFRGQTKNDGYDMLAGAALGLDGVLSNGQYVAYSKPLGLSFCPNLSAQYGHYTDFSVRVDFDFS